MGRARKGGFAAVQREQFRAQGGEVDFLSVGSFEGVFAEDHGASEVLDGLFDNVGQDAHQGVGLLFAEAFGFEAGNEFQGVEMVVAGSWRSACEVAGGLLAKKGYEV